MPRVLFLLKNRDNYHEFCSYGGSSHSGLLNSAELVQKMLEQSGVDAKLVQVTDNNDIDREVTEYKPSHVVIEALWVVPEKFEVLQKLHPSVKWIVRLHSELPFLATEGIAIDWIKKYVTYENVWVATNSFETYLDLIWVVDCENKLLHLPNYYPMTKIHRRVYPPQNVLNVGCFGAIRPLKNQLTQAVAAVKYAEAHGKTLFFHINATRQEQRGDNVYKNLKALFEGTAHRLIEHSWMDHESFLITLQCMDVAMSVSLTESYCLAAADAVSQKVPLVCSIQIPWASSFSQVQDPTSVEEIVRKMDKVLNPFWKTIIVRHNLAKLTATSKAAKSDWLNYLLDKWYGV